VLNIGIEAKCLVETPFRPRGRGSTRPMCPFLLTCSPLGLELNAPSLQVGMREMRRLRIERLESLLREKPGDWELSVLLAEAKEEDANEEAVALAEALEPFKDEIPAPVPPPRPSVRELRRQWAETRQRIFAAKKEKQKTG
jgi:hypothetical protein